MRRLLSKFIFLSSILLGIFSFVSCEVEESVKLTDRLTYLEAPYYDNIYTIYSVTSDFKKLPEEGKNNFYKILRNKDNMLWLKIDFTIPKYFKYQDLALYIPQLHSASELYLNYNFIKRYGSFPPTELSSGFQSQIFLFPKEMLNLKGENTILIKCWPGAIGCIYGDVYIGPQKPLLKKAETTNFHNSRGILVISGILVVMCLFYLFLYNIMKRFEKNKEYLYFALTLFYTIHFLVPFILPEISWVKVDFVSYLFIVKFFFGVGGVSTTYFANSFILTYIEHKPTIKNTSPRLFIWLISTICIFLIPDYSHVRSMMIFAFCFSLLQFVYTIPVLIKALFTPKTSKIVQHLLIGFIPVLIAVPIDLILRFVIKDNTKTFFTISGWQITIFIFLVFLLFRFSKLYIHNGELSTQLSDINAHLEEIVDIRTKELSKANYNLTLGLDTVSKVQHNFLPPQNRSFQGWDLAVYFKALDHEVSGDLYDYYYQDSTLQGFGLFDVSGHGISAGLMTILAKGIISQKFLNGINAQEPLSEILQEINETYIKEKVNIENYITGVLFHFDFMDNTDICSVEMANAGHPYPLFYNSEKNTVSELKHSDLQNQFGFLGVDGLPVSFPSLYFTTKENDIIVCFTDGVTESKNKQGEDFTKDRLIQLINENKNESAEIIKEKIKSALDDFTNDVQIEDDISFIVLKRTSVNNYIEEI